MTTANEKKPATRADLHCHSTASQVSKLGVQRALGLPECATPPEEVYALAKRRGMDFVTITDHDTIDGVLEIADRPDVFVSEELTARFRGEPQAVHILCYGITPDDHEWLQAHAGDVEAVAEYLHEHEIACALAHPFYAVEAPLQPRHRRRLAQLFAIWEVRNGSRARELNHRPRSTSRRTAASASAAPTTTPGVDIGRTWTETPAGGDAAASSSPTCAPAASSAHGEQGSAAKWAHAAMALAVRALGRGDGDAAPDPARRAADGRARDDARATPAAARSAADLGPEDARALLRAWLDAVDLRPERARAARAACSPTASRTPTSSGARAAATSAGCSARSARRWRAPTRGERLGGAAPALFDGLLRGHPLRAGGGVPRAREAQARRARRRAAARRARRRRHRRRCTASRTRSTRSASAACPASRSRSSAPTRNVDRRLSAVAEVEIPFYAGAAGRRAEPARGRRGAGRGPLRRCVHLCSPGPAGVAAALVARVLGLPIVGSYHTELAAYAALRSGDARARAGVDARARPRSTAAATSCSRRSAASDARLAALGIDAERIGRWDRGVDARALLARRCATRRCSGARPRALRRPADAEKGADLLADAFLAARARDPRLELVLAGGGPEEERAARAARRRARRSSAGSRATSSRAPTRAPTCSSSARRPTPSGRCCSRRRRAACRSSPSTRAARPS